MNTQQFGKFIVEQRKAKGYTQKELADRLGVTDKAISRWENGHGYPDISLIEPLAKELEVTVLELMHGQRNEENSIVSSDVNEAISNAIEITISGRNSERKKTFMILIVSIVLLAGVAFFQSIPAYGIIVFVVMLAYAFAGVGLLIQSFAAKRKNAIVGENFFYSALLILTALGILLLLLCSSVSVVH